MTAGDKYTHSGIILNYADNFYWISMRDSNLKKVENGITTTISGSGDSISLGWGGDNADYSISVSNGDALEVMVEKDSSSRTYADADPHLDSGRIGFIVISGGSGNYFIADDVSFHSEQHQPERLIYPLRRRC